MSRLPVVGGDRDNWGQVLNDYLSVEHNSDGSLKLRTDGSLSDGIADGSVSAAKLSSTVNNYLASAQTAVQSVNGESGQAITLTASDVSAIATSAAGAASGVATLDGSSRLPSGQLPLNVPVRSGDSSDTGKAMDAYTGLPTTIYKGAYTDARREFGVLGDGTPEDEARVHVAAASGKNLYFPQPDSAWVLTSPIAITAAGQKILAPSGTWRQTGTRMPVFDVRTSADFAQVEVDTLEYSDPDTRWDRAADRQASIRGERQSAWCAGFYTCASNTRFKAKMVTGFYVAGMATNWNTTNNSKDASGTYRSGNYMELEFSNCTFGIVPWGQRGFDFNLRGSYSSAPFDFNPPHALYYTPTNPSKDGRGTGYVFDSSGAGHCFEVVRSGTVSGGSFRITVQKLGGAAQQTGSIAWNANAATVTSALESLSNVNPGDVRVWDDLPDPLQAANGYRIVFAHSFGPCVSQTGLTVDSSSITGGGSYVASEFQPFNSGGAWRFKELNGGAFGPLIGREVPGIAEIYQNTKDVTFELFKSIDDDSAIDDDPSTGGSLVNDSSTSRIRIQKAEIILSGDSRAVNWQGTDCSIDSLEVTAASPDLGVNDPYVLVRGTRTKVVVDSIVNTGAGGRYGVSSWSGDDLVITAKRLRGINRVGVELKSGVTNSSVAVDSRAISFQSGITQPGLPWADFSANTTNRFNRGSELRNRTGIVLPQQAGWKGIGQAPTSQRAYFMRLCLDDWSLANTLLVSMTGVPAGSEQIDWGLYNSTGNAIWRAGATTVTAGAGTKTVTVPAEYRLVLPEKIMYVGFWMDVGVGMQMADWSTGVAPTNLLSSSIPIAEHLALSSQVSGLPADMSGAGAGAGAVPSIAVRNI